MEDFILSIFEKRDSKVGHPVMMRELAYNYFSNLNPKQQDQAYEAINSLIDKGFITHEDQNKNMECLRLTQLGYDNLYQNSRDVSDIEKMIMREFEKQNSRPGNVLAIKNLNFGLVQNLNPLEIERFEPAINNLIDKELITYEKNGLECIRLTERGYETLY